MKVRVTIAASGQGRWGEELDFPVDCVNSGYLPVLLVLDPTPNPKLDELRKVFLENNGLVFIGDEAWQHLDAEAGPTMATFLEKYVRKPISDLPAHRARGTPRNDFGHGWFSFYGANRPRSLRH